MKTHDRKPAKLRDKLRDWRRDQGKSKSTNKKMQTFLIAVVGFFFIYWALLFHRQGVTKTYV